MSDPRAGAVRSASALAAQVRTDVIYAERSGASWPALSRALQEISSFTTQDIDSLDATTRLIAVACLEDLQIALERHRLTEEAASVVQATRVLATRGTLVSTAEATSAPGSILGASESAIA